METKPETATEAGIMMNEPNTNAGYRFCKRVFDILFALIGLIVLIPFGLITALAIFLDDPGPVFFFQDRNGLNGKVFRMWKFRTMFQNAPELREQLGVQNELDGPAFKMKNDTRVTRVGRALRRTNLDELPQLVNILKGEMSFVGPRPLPTYETALLNEQQKRRMSVKPGLVCYWQVCGNRYNIPFKEWMKMDYKYINEASVLTDLKILCMAIPAVISDKGA